MKVNQIRQRKIYDKMKLAQNIYEFEQLQQLKTENHKLKKQLKEAQAKRLQITKQCSQITKQLQQLRNKNHQLEQKLHLTIQNTESSKFPLQQLRFLNKQLNAQIQQLRAQNQQLNQKIRYSKDVIERKYDQLEQKTFKRIEQAIKRLKKSIHYLQSLSSKQIQKTKEQYQNQIRAIVENLGKAVELLRGKYLQQDPNTEIQQLMNPLKIIQQELHKTQKQLNRLKQQNNKFEQQIFRHRKIQKQLLPQYKQALQKLKRNLADVRCQLAQNQYDKDKVKKSYQSQIKLIQSKYNDLYTQFRKIQLQNQIYKNKLVDLQEDVQEQKQRLIEQNNILKKLYHNNEKGSEKKQEVDVSQFTEREKLTKKYSNESFKKQIKKNSSSRSRSRKHSTSGLNDELNDDSSLESQQSLKNEILKIDREIIEIQQTLAKQLDIYR